MKVLLVLSGRKVHRPENIEIYNALKGQVKDLTWCSGTSCDLDSENLSRGLMYLDRVELGGAHELSARAARFSPHTFDIAIIDQSLDLTQDQSPAIGGGIANRSLDSQGCNRPSELAQTLTNCGVVCIGTSRNGSCLEELTQFGGAVLSCPLEELMTRLPSLLPEAERLVKDNRPGGGLKALTLRQPFAWSIFHAGKDVENRIWPTRIRDTIAIHAVEQQPTGTYERSKEFIRSVLKKLGVRNARIPSYERLDKGAIIGLVDIVDCVVESSSKWFEGPIGFVLANPRPLPCPIPCESKRRFFTVSPEVEKQIQAMLSGKKR